MIYFFVVNLSFLLPIFLLSMHSILAKSCEYLQVEAVSVHKGCTYKMYSSRQWKHPQSFQIEDQEQDLRQKSPNRIIS